MRSRARGAWLLVVILASLALTTRFFASSFERSVESRWRGAWVVTKVPVQSDCSGLHTDNAVSGTLVSSRGRFSFRAGELARIDKIDLHRARVDLVLSLPEPILVTTQDGPFTLYNEVRCPLELDIDVPRDKVSNDDLAGIEWVLQQVVERYTSMEEAQRSRAWNQRKRDPYPADYEQTLADHQAWKAQQVNVNIQARLDRARDETSRLTDRLTSDHDYLEGFAAGVEAMKAVNLGGCGDLLARDFGSFGSAPQAPRSSAATSEAQQRWGRGYQDGQKLVFGLESLRRLPSCFIPVPEAQNAVQHRPPH